MREGLPVGFHDERWHEAFVCGFGVLLESGMRQ